MLQSFLFLTCKSTNTSRKCAHINGQKKIKGHKVMHTSWKWREAVTFRIGGLGLQRTTFPILRWAWPRRIRNTPSFLSLVFFSSFFFFEQTSWSWSCRAGCHWSVGKENLFSRSACTEKRRAGGRAGDAFVFVALSRVCVLQFIISKLGELLVQAAAAAREQQGCMFFHTSAVCYSSSSLGAAFSPSAPLRQLEYLLLLRYNTCSNCTASFATV